jgi:hypothetical protein
MREQKISFNFQFNLVNFFKINFSSIKQAFKANSNPGKFKLILVLIFVTFTPLTYNYSMSTFQETSDGIYYLTDAISLLLNNFQNSDSLLDNKDSNNLLNIKNAIYFSSKSFKLSASKFESLQSPLYFPILKLLGINDQPSMLVTTLNRLSSFTGTSTLDLISSIEDYLTFMYQLSKEIVRRARWWDLEQNNITYNPKIDFYDKFEYKVSIRVQENVIKFKNDFFDIKNLINASFLKNYSFITNFYSQIDKLNLILDQVVYITKLAPSLLNATFKSVEITNALAFDQFVTAKKLNVLSQYYLEQTQKHLENATNFDNSLSSTISDINKILIEFNDLNYEFVNMTDSSELHFVSLGNIVSSLNNISSISQGKLFNKTGDYNDFLVKNHRVQEIVDRNIDKLKNYIEKSSSLVRFPFKDILNHFLWFYEGYQGAIIGYRNLFLSAKGTIDVFIALENFNNSFISYIQNERNNLSVPTLNKTIYNSYYNEYNETIYLVSETSKNFNQSVVNGAIKVNISLWENLLGYNRSFDSKKDTGFLEFLKNFYIFWRDFHEEIDFTKYFNAFDTYFVRYHQELLNLVGTGIFLSLSEEIINN